MLPIGTHDYSRALSDAATYQPQVLVDLMGGEDQANSLRQIVRSGLTENMAVGGALFELESILAVPDAARIGWWTMEWWWNQPNLPQIKAFDAAIRSRTSKAASARHWFGYAAVRTIVQVANQENRWIRSCSPARCKDTRCPPTSRSMPIAHSSAIATMNS